MTDNKLHLIGYASGIAGADSHSGDGPIVMQQSQLLSELIKEGVPLVWDGMITPPENASLSPDAEVAKMCQILARKVSALISKRQRVSVMGGDHTSAIGTWSGVYDALYTKGDIGLIWVDAHMDSHTPETSESGHIHGMPLASLLGYGYSSLTNILQPGAKLKPENVCLIGVRSFEKGEAELLKRLNVRIYFMDEVKERGFTTVLRDALDLVTKNTIAYGLTLDIDSIDPEEAPGVDVPESNGIHVSDLCEGLLEIAADPRLIATEIVEFDPTRDKDQLTEKLIVSLLAILGRQSS